MINLDFLEPHTPSLCIPRVFNNIGESRIREVFDQLELGLIQRVDIIQRKNEKGEEYKRVFIHFARWSNSPAAQKARRKLLTGDSIKIVYDNPWFWKVEANKAVRFEREVRPKENKKMRPVLVLDENDTDHVSEMTSQQEYTPRPRKQQQVRFQRRERQTQTQRTPPHYFKKYSRQSRQFDNDNDYRTPTPRPRPKYDNYDDIDREDEETATRKLDFDNVTLRAPKKKVLGKKILEVEELNEVSRELYGDLEVEEVEEELEEEKEIEPEEVSDDEDFNRT